MHINVVIYIFLLADYFEPFGIYSTLLVSLETFFSGLGVSFSTSKSRKTPSFKARNLIKVY